MNDDELKEFFKADVFSGTKEVDEALLIDKNNLQNWFNKNIENAGNIELIEQFKGGQSNPTYKIHTSKNA